jgi:hypothetical protein
VQPHVRIGSVATLDRCSVIVCSTPYLLTESLRRRETSLCASNGPEHLQQESAESDALLNHLISPRKQRGRHRDPHGLRDLEVDDEFETRGLFDGDFSGPSTAKNLDELSAN